MAQKVLVQLLDDIDGSEAVGTLEFSFGGETVLVDLNEDHMNEYDQILSYLKSVGRVVKGTKKRAPYGSKKGTGPVVGKTQEMREWLRAAGHEVKDRGRVPSHLVKLWEERPQGDVKVIREDNMSEIAKSFKEEAPVVAEEKPKKTPRKPATPRKTSSRTKPPATQEMAAILAFKEPEDPAKTSHKPRARKTSTNQV